MDEIRRVTQITRAKPYSACIQAERRNTTITKRRNQLICNGSTTGIKGGITAAGLGTDIAYSIGVTPLPESMIPNRRK
ncbi:MAG TPA: hypothetical protein VF934_04955 [Burkholderiales bacterium]